MSGDGSLYKRTGTRPNGRTYTRWVAQTSSGPRGSRRIVRKVCRTRVEARVALDGLLAGRNVSKRSLGDYLREWLRDTASVSPNTRRGYEDVIAHFAPIAEVRLGDLTAEDVERCLRGMTARRKGQQVATLSSAKSRRNALAMLRRALSVALRRGHVRENVALLVDMPRVRTVPRAALTPERAQAILEAVRGDRYEAAYALGLVGLRASEILGLSWGAFDERAGVIHVREQLAGSGRSGHLVPLKTAASAAPIPLPGFVVRRLVEHRERQRAERPFVPLDDGLVFVTPAGLPVNGSWLTRHFQAMLERSGIPKMRLHDLRHGCAGHGTRGWQAIRRLRGRSHRGCAGAHRGDPIGSPVSASVSAQTAIPRTNQAAVNRLVVGSSPTAGAILQHEQGTPDARGAPGRDIREALGEVTGSANRAA